MWLKLWVLRTKIGFTCHIIYNQQCEFTSLSKPVNWHVIAAGVFWKKVKMATENENENY